MKLSGHLREKNGYYYMVINYPGEDGKRKQYNFRTGLTVKGNKTKAQEMLDRKIEELTAYHEEHDIFQKDGLMFTDFLLEWLETAKASIAPTTARSYEGFVKGKIVPYFKDKQIPLKNLKPLDLQRFYADEMKTVSANSALHYHAVIHRALNYAVRMELIDRNPADRVDRPKVKKYNADYYRGEELTSFLEATKNNKYGLLFQMTAFYGFRRSEVLGLKWGAIDFDNNMITVRHTVTEVRDGGKMKLVFSDTTKTRSSTRTLPLTKEIKKKLLDLKRRQDENREVCGDSYNHEFDEYVFVDALGNIFTPRAVSEAFAALIEKNGLRKIRFHDLRHSCASLMLVTGVPLKQIQEWLGHSDISTTANIYSHLDFASKIASAVAMDGALQLPEDDDEEDWKTI